MLVQGFHQLREEKVPVQLSIVGLGPYAATLQEQLPEACFTGFLAGEALDSAYASANNFVFPSTTDTFGNAIIKAQAAGLSLTGSVVASDAFFPFRDGLDVVADNGAVAVIQPGGSMRDAEVITAADERGVSQAFPGVRSVRHWVRRAACEGGALRLGVVR